MNLFIKLNSKFLKNLKVKVKLQLLIEQKQKIGKKK